MVLGSTREQPIVGGQDVAPRGSVEEWRAERGAVRWEGAGDLAGGFPGFAARGGRLVGVQVRLTDYYLLVEEGRPHGFGLPLSWLLGADLFAPRVERSDPTLRLRYDDGAAARTFQIRFRGSLLAPRGGRRAEQVLTHLHALGLGGIAEPLPEPPEFAVSWDDAAKFEGENVIWSGQASAFLGAAGERVPSDVWLTTRSVIWGSSVGSGILRLPIEAAIDVVPADLADRAGTPAVYVAATDDHGGRHEVPFVFDRHSPAQRNHRERGAFLVGLRSRGVPLGTIPPLPQPWRDPALPQVPLPAVETTESPGEPNGGRGSVRQRIRRPGPTGRFRPRPIPADVAEAPGRWERAMAEWTGRPNWPEPQDHGQLAAAEPSARERLTHLLETGSDHTASPGDGETRSARGIILPWPGTRRNGGGSTAPTTETGAPSAPPVAEAAPIVAPRTAADAADAADVPTAAQGETDAAPASPLPFLGSWPIPSGFVGTAVNGGPVGTDREGANPVVPPVEQAAAGAVLAGEQQAVPEPTRIGPLVDQEPATGLASRGESAATREGVGDEPRAALRRYEAAVLRQITDALRAIDDHPAATAAPTMPPPTAAARADALSALDTLVAHGELTAERAEVHRSLLVAAGEAGPRLRSLIELREAGYLAADDLDRKRRQIVAPLADLLTR